MSARSVCTFSLALTFGMLANAQQPRTWDDIQESPIPAWARRPTYDASRNSPLEAADAMFDTGDRRALFSVNRDVPSPTVTVHQLQHRVPWKARREWEQAVKAFNKGKSDQVERHLKRAIELDPGFVEARNNLAALYLGRQQPREALPLLEEAVRIDPANYLPYTNLAIAYLMLGEDHNAEDLARRALQLDRITTRTKLIMGMILVTEGKYTPEALRLLTRASGDYPQAKLLQAQIHASHGELKQARTRVTEYLASGNTFGRDTAQYWLRILDQAERPAAASQAGTQ